MAHYFVFLVLWYFIIIMYFFSYFIGLRRYLQLNFNKYFLFEFTRLLQFFVTRCQYITKESMPRRFSLDFDRC
jgi:hypothetical protein